MSTTIDSREWFDKTLERNAALLPLTGGVPFAAMTRQAGMALADVRLPDRSQESWRYSSLDRLYQQLFTLPARESAAEGLPLGEMVFADHACYRVVMVNGRLAEHLSQLPNPEDGVQISALSRLSGERRAETERLIQEQDDFHDDAFAQLNRALMHDGLLIRVASGAAVDKPIELLHVNLSNAQQILVPPSFLIVLEQGAQAELVERYSSLDDAEYFYNGMTDIRLHEQATLRHHRILRAAANAHHLNRLSVRQLRGSRYESMQVATDAGWSRNDIRSHLLEPGAVCRLSGVYTVGASQSNDFHIDIRHRAPDCTSETNFRGVLHGIGKAVFDGRILVEQDAQHTDAQLSNKNLLLVEGAEVNTKPQLEIYADDVKCSHGTTVGRIDPNHLFYLRSRGIDEQRAFRMLCLGFVQQVINEVDDPAVRHFIQQQLSNTLSEVSQ